MLSGVKQYSNELNLTGVAPKTKEIEFFRRAGFGVGIGYWTKKNQKRLVAGLALLKQKPQIAIYFSGILGYLSFAVKLPKAQIKGRLRRYFANQFQLLEQEYFFFVWFSFTTNQN